MWTIITDGIQLNCVDTYLIFFIKYAPGWVSATVAFIALIKAWNPVLVWKTKRSIKGLDDAEERVNEESDEPITAEVGEKFKHKTETTASHYTKRNTFKIFDRLRERPLSKEAQLKMIKEKRNLYMSRLVKLI